MENGVIEAGSRDHKNAKQDLTNCSYFTEDYRESLSYYADGDFASADPDAVREFCVEHLPDLWPSDAMK